jgi:endonuclease G
MMRHNARLRIGVALAALAAAQAISGCRPAVRRVGPAEMAPAPGLTAAQGCERRAEYAGSPVPSPELEITRLDKCFFVVGYCEARRNPAWVGFRLGPAADLTAYPSKRFVIDQDTVARVSHDDYTHSGFDRGHMAPRFAISSRYGLAGNDATFIMSNVCPQFHSLNDGHWGDLEEWIAGKKKGEEFLPGWADFYGEVWVTVGPIFDDHRDPLPAGVPVPSAFYCIVLDEEPGADGGASPRAIAFIMEHLDVREDDLTQFLTTIDEVERRTGLDFFSDLPDDLEESLESRGQPGLWALPQPPN